MLTRSSDTFADTGTLHVDDAATLGTLLRRARERRGVTLDQVSAETKIPRRQLEALERDDQAATLDGFYRRAQIRTYAHAVQLDPQLVRRRLDRMRPPRALPPDPPKATTAANGAAFPPRALIVVIVVMAAGVLGRMERRRESVAAHDVRLQPATVSQPKPATPVGRTELDAAVPVLRTESPSDAPTPERSRTGPVNATAAQTANPSRRDPVAEKAAPPQDSVSELKAAPPADSVSELIVMTEPAGARVTVNGIGWGDAPATIRYLPSGGKRVRVSKDGFVTEERDVQLTETGRRVLNIRLRPSR